MPHAMPLLGTLSRSGYLALCDPVSCDDPLAEPRAIQARAGATLPVKWRVLDAEGAPVSDAEHFAGVTSTAPPASSGSRAGVPRRRLLAVPLADARRVRGPAPDDDPLPAGRLLALRAAPVQLSRAPTPALAIRP